MKGFSHINIGDELSPIESEPISKEWLKKYADISGDYSLIHLDQEAAQDSGFSNIIAHGMLSMGICTRLFSSWLHSSIKEVQFSVRYLSPLYLGDRLILSGQVVDVDDKKPSVKLVIYGKNQSDEAILKGSVEIGL